MLGGSVGAAGGPQGVGSLLARFALVIGVCAAAIAVGIGGASLGGAVSTGGVALGVFLVVAAAMPTVARLRRDRLDAPGIYALVTAIELGLVSLAWLGNPPGQGPGLSRDDIAQALLLVALAIGLFGIGVRLMGPSRPRTPLRFDPALAPSRSALLWAFFIGMVGAGVAAAAGAFGYISSPTGGAGAFGQIFSFLERLSGIVVLVTALVAFNNRDRKLMRILAVFVLLRFALGFISGVKTSSLEPFLFVGLAYVACGGKVPWRTGLIVGAFAMLVVIPAATAYRANVRDNQQTASQALSSAFSNRKSTTLSKAVDGAYRYTIGRFRHIDSVALIVNRTPSVYPYAGGTIYLDLPAIIVVPRAVWHNKPTLDLGVKFSHTYWQVPEQLNTSTPLTHPGDLYRNFGLGGVIVGMLLWGVAIGLWQRLYTRLRSPRWELVFLYALLYGVATIEPDLPELIATASKDLPLVALVGWVLLPGANGALPGYRRVLSTSR